MKPVQSSNSTADSSSILEPISMNTSESTKTLEVTGNIKKQTLEIDWKSSSTAEQTTEGRQILFFVKKSFKNKQNKKTIHPKKSFCLMLIIFQLLKRIQ